MNKKKTMLYQMTFTQDEYEVIKMHLNAFDKDDVCSRYNWCGEYSEDCSKCPVTTMLNKFNIKKKKDEGVDK